VGDVSLELCGGTHVPSTGQIALFRFTHETGAAAGVRRIEGVTGPAAYALVRKLEAQLEQAAGLLRAQPEHLLRRIEAMVEENKKLERQLADRLRQGEGAAQGTVERVGDVDVFVSESDLDDRDQIVLLMDAFRSNHHRSVSVLFTNGERPGVHVAVTDDLVERGLKAGAIASAIAALSGGKGGGRPHLASAGLGDPSSARRARGEVVNIIRQLVGS
jgi:alanyl-tRNA synthetase